MEKCLSSFRIQFCCPKCVYRVKNNKCESGWSCNNKATYCPSSTICCFTKGTNVLISNKLEKPIEELIPWNSSTKSGDTVFSIDGSLAYVVDIVKYFETHPIINIEVSSIEDESFFSISMTQFHTLLVRHNFLISANLLEVGDQIHTIKGKGIVKSIEYEDYNDVVYNIVLASEKFIEILPNMNNEIINAFSKNSLLDLTPKDHIIFTNGIATADWNLQGQFKDGMRNGINISQFS